MNSRSNILFDDNSYLTDHKDTVNDNDASMSTYTEDEYEVDISTFSFKSYSNPKYYFEKGKLCCKIVCDYHSKIKQDKESSDNMYMDLISFEQEKEDRAMKQLTGRYF